MFSSEGAFHKVLFVTRWSLQVKNNLNQESSEPGRRPSQHLPGSLISHEGMRQPEKQWGVVMFALSQLDMPGEKAYYELKRLLERWMEADSASS